MRNLSYTFILITCIYIGSTSCTDEIRPLTMAEMNVIDTLYRNETEILKVELDSLCKIEYDLVYKRSVDSIKAVRLKEIKSILGK